MNQWKMKIENTTWLEKVKAPQPLPLQLQSLTVRALDDDNHVMMASLNLIAAFNVVNIDLLLKQLSIVGLPKPCGVT